MIKISIRVINYGSQDSGSPEPLQTPKEEFRHSSVSFDLKDEESLDAIERRPSMMILMNRMSHQMRRLSEISVELGNMSELEYAN